MNYSTVENIFWPFVLIVGRRITLIDDSEKRLFWRDHAWLSAFIVLPATLLDWLAFGLPDWTFLFITGIPIVIYILFILKWRAHLKQSDGG